MRLEDINILNEDRIESEFTRCCGSRTWVNKMLKNRPFKDESALMSMAEKIWYDCSPGDWLEAFSHHPRIGENRNELEKKFASTKNWASSEQKGVENAHTGTLQRLVELNQEYEKRFGYIFIVSATGKTAEEMLTLLKTRLSNSLEDEIKIAMGEQNKITLLRLKKLLS